MKKKKKNTLRRRKPVWIHTILNKKITIKIQWIGNNILEIH